MTLSPCGFEQKNWLAYAEVAKLHDALEQLGPVSEKHGIMGTSGISDLIKQHKDVQQQIADAKQRAAKLELVADLEKRQAHFEACLSAGVYVATDTSCLAPASVICHSMHPYLFGLIAFHGIHASFCLTAACYFVQSHIVSEIAYASRYTVCSPTGRCTSHCLQLMPAATPVF